MDKMKNYSLIKFLSVFLCFSTNFTGCFSYFSVSNNDFSNIQHETRIRIILKDNREFIVQNINEINFSKPDTIQLFQNDKLITLSADEIRKLAEEKFDFGKTCFSGVWITMGIVAGLLIIFLIYGLVEEVLKCDISNELISSFFQYIFQSRSFAFLHYLTSAILVAAIN